MSDRRRQGMLREAQVADLYGEKEFRDILFQSQTMPLPVPLGFGCGYVKAGDWSPARHELEHYVPQPKPLQRLLHGPYAWFDSLRELKGVVAEKRIQARPVAELLKSGLVFGGFSSLSALINEATVNAKRDPNNWYSKVSMTTAASAAYWLFLQAGYPSAGAVPAAGVASTAPTASSPAGFFGQANAPGSNTKHLVSATAMSTIAAGALLIVDITLMVQPVLATTGAQTITGNPARYQTNGNNGVLPFLFEGASNNATSPGALTLTYTESTVGTTGRTAVPGTSQASCVANRTAFANGAFFCPLQAGDVGIRRIETAGWAAAQSVATPVCFGLAYPYCFIPLPTANALFGTDLLNTQFNLPQVIDGAAITFFLAAATTTSGLIQGELVLVSGNS